MRRVPESAVISVIVGSYVFVRDSSDLKCRCAKVSRFWTSRQWIRRMTSPRNPRVRGGAARAFRHLGSGRTLWMCSDRRKHALRRATVSIGFRHVVVAASDRLFGLLAGIACGESHDLRAFVETHGVFLPQRSFGVLALCLGASASAYVADNRRTNCAPYTNRCWRRKNGNFMGFYDTNLASVTSSHLSSPLWLR